jgi:serine protease Do
MRILPLAMGLILLGCGPLKAQDRDTKVRNDKSQFGTGAGWIYNNLEEGIRAAKADGKPMLVIFRCIPCEACQEFDDDVARRDPIIRDLLDEFVCVRIVQANVMDLTHFQFDFDLSFAAFLMNPDLTIYGRFATRSERPESDDISLEGLRKAMAAALKMHKEYEKVKPSLAGKQVTQARFRTPNDLPALKDKYQPALNYSGPVARSCMHCHQIRDAERTFYRSSGESMSDVVVFPYPDPSVLGLSMDPHEMATVKRVAPGSPAEQDGLRSGDVIRVLAGQPLLSTADFQWVLQNAPATGTLLAEVLRAGKPQELALTLKPGWRRGDISWRTTTWNLRRMGLGGMRLDDLKDSERREAGLPPAGLALRARHVGEYGDHAVAKRAGFQKDDVLISFDGHTEHMTESALLAYTLQQKRPGDVVDVVVLRQGQKLNLKFALQ